MEPTNSGKAIDKFEVPKLTFVREITEPPGKFAASQFKPVLECTTGGDGPNLVGVQYPGLSIFIVVFVLGSPMTFILMFGGWKRLRLLTPPPHEKIVCSERGVSGHSNRNFWTKIGTGRTSLTVQVTPEWLYIRPGF